MVGHPIKIANINCFLIISPGKMTMTHRKWEITSSLKSVVHGVKAGQRIPSWVCQRKKDHFVDRGRQPDTECKASDGGIKGRSNDSALSVQRRRYDRSIPLDEFYANDESSTRH